MKEHSGFQLPDCDRHFTRYSDLAAYQQAIREVAMQHVTGTELAIDAGAHVGIFTRWFEARFARVLAIEPDAENYRCLSANIGPSTTAIRKGLGSNQGWGRVERHTRENTGDNRVHRSGAPPSHDDERFVRIITLDKLLAKRLPGVPVRLIKLDLQGAEIAMLQGARDTLERWSPVLIVETMAATPPMLRPDRDLERLGYVQQQRVHKDQIWSRPA